MVSNYLLFNLSDVSLLALHPLEDVVLFMVNYHSLLVLHAIMEHAYVTDQFVQTLSETNQLLF